MMIKIRTKLFMSLSVLIIVFLIIASSQNMISIKALLEEENNQYSKDSFDRSTWKWNTTEVVSTESSSGSYDPSLAVDSAGNVHIVWYDTTTYAGAGADNDIFYKRQEASTSTWTTTEVVSTESSGHSWFPSLATDSAGNVHIVWYDTTTYAGSGDDWDIFYKRWEASTSSWTTTEVVSTESTGHSYNPSLAVDSTGTIHIAWYDETNDYAGSGFDEDIFYKRWEASTSTWTTTEVVSTESSGISAYPSLTTDVTGDVYIAWWDLTDYAGAGADDDIFYKCWEASTSSWTTTEVVSTESTENSEFPSLAVDSTGTIHIAWQDWTDYAGSGTGWDIFYKRWDFSTSSWTSTEFVSTESTGYSYNPSLAVDSAGTIHIAWYDETDYTGAGTDDDIFYKRWDDSTSTWSTTEVVSIESTDDSIYPSLAVDSAGTIHIAWEDHTNHAGAGGDSDIFYKLLAGPSVAPAPAPELAFIVPNPTDINTVYLDWNNVLRATNYYVYRSSSYIWSVEGLKPITNVSSSEYIDTLLFEGSYFYVVVAGNFAGNSSHSNCQYVEVKFPELEAPELSHILPNPTDITSISLVWDSIDGAIEYYIYRSTSYIWSVEGLTPIATVVLTSYVDTLTSEGIYLYVIVANDGLRNSTHSNCEYVEYKLPTLNEFFITFGIFGGVAVILITTINLRKRKNERIN